jgi:hypothetical protein
MPYTGNILGKTHYKKEEGSMRTKKFSIMMLCMLLVAAFMYGCGSSKKEGSASPTSPGAVAKVDEVTCFACHSDTLEPLSGDAIVPNFTNSVHNLNSVGCQDCHGGGSEHFGVGPIPFPTPNYQQCADCHNGGVGTSYPLVTAYEGSKHLGVMLEPNGPCNRCHTHQGAVLAVVNHFTGDGEVMESGVNEPGGITEEDAEPIKCNTCHVTHRTEKLRVDTAWDPSTTAGTVTSSLADGKNDQYRLCTQCHGFINVDGKIMGSGTAASGTVLVGHHDTSWNRIIATTHYDDPATSTIEGYKVRFTLPDGSANPNACFDCHGHEAKTNSTNDPALSSYDPASDTIYTSWARSGHAGGLLTAKWAAARSVTIPAGSRTDPARVAAQHQQVDAVMAASVDAGPFGGHNSGSCARCHSTEGFSYFFENFENIPVAASAGVIKCYGCHSNPAAGILRTMKGAKANTNYTTDLGWVPPGYALNYGKKPYPDVAASNICIACHDSREKDPGAITDTNNSNYQRTHYLQAAATMYVKMGFIAFTDADTLVPGSTTVTYRKSLMSDQDGGTITSTHRKLGTPGMVGDSHNPDFFVPGHLDSNGPCVVCHLTGSHTLAIDQKAITAVCNKCHDEEGGHDITTIAAFRQYFLDPQSEAYEDALTLAITIFNNKNTGISLAPEPSLPEFVRAYKTGTTSEAGAADWDAAMAILGAGYNRTKVLGAVSNIVFLKREAAAFAHARTYSRRLLYDSIDYLDNGAIDSSASATAVAVLPALFGKNATNAFTDGTLTTLAPGTTEAMVYLIGWSRSTGKWNANERP